MNINYVQSQAQALALIRAAGRAAKFTRAGTVVASAAAFEAKSEQKDDPSSLLAQTTQTRKTFYVSATIKPLQVGDVMTRNKETFTITKLIPFKPAAVTLYYVVEVV